MSLLHFFKPLDTLPTAEQTGLSVHAVSSANSAVQRVLDAENTDHTRARKLKYTITFTTKYHAKVGVYGMLHKMG